jgi:thiamine biosynthesis lipoprotein
MNKFLRIILVALIIPVVSGCSKPLYQESEFRMGSFIEVISRDPRASSIVFAEFKRLEGIFNLYDETSELSRLNASGSMVVSPELFDILKKSKRFYELTDGAFDVTVAPLALLWKKAISKKQLPKDADVKTALTSVGSDYIYLDEKLSLVRLLKEGLHIDLGGIAKGYAVDRAVTKLKEAHINSALVNAGGNMFCLGENGRKPWSVGIQNPRKEGEVLEKLVLRGKGVSTSGDYEQFFIFQNRRYSHIIDPKTGYPAGRGVISATLIASDATTADALSTACVVLGLKSSIELLKRFPDVKAKLIDEQGKIYDL